MPSPLPGFPLPIDLEPLSRHRNVGLLFSGGKDSLALVYLLRGHLDQLTVYHCDTGDLLPEIADVVAKVETMCPRFVRVRTDARGWIAANGFPADLLPVHCGPVGRLMHHGEAGSITVVDKHHCCDANRWAPLRQRLNADGVTLNIRGTRRADPGYGIVAATPGRRPSPHSSARHSPASTSIGATRPNARAAPRAGAKAAQPIWWSTIPSLPPTTLQTSERCMGRSQSRWRAWKVN